MGLFSHFHNWMSLNTVGVYKYHAITLQLRYIYKQLLKAVFGKCHVHNKENVLAAALSLTSWYPELVSLHAYLSTPQYCHCHQGALESQLHPGWVWAKEQAFQQYSLTKRMHWLYPCIHAIFEQDNTWRPSTQKKLSKNCTGTMRLCDPYVNY